MRFEPMTEADVPMVAEWLGRPHVTEWWGPRPSTDEVRERYLSGDGSTVSYLAYLGDEAVGFIQSYIAMGSGDGWWTEETDPGVRGIDQLLADPARLGRGLGAQLVAEFVAFLFEDPSTTKVQADPAVGNARAIRSYEKVGFRRVGTVTTPDGEAMLMVMDRP
jgi:RimJ/RimL family protein N-acetyltransferase